jgi:putative transposase
VWCPKYRRPVLTDQVAQRLEELIREQVDALRGQVVALEIQPDHVHVFAEFPPTLAVRQIVHRLKGHTSHKLRKGLDWLNRRLPSLWTRSYYVGTAGHGSAETIRRYIEAQSGR